MPKEVSFGAMPKSATNIESWVENREVPTSDSTSQPLSTPSTNGQSTLTMEELNQPKLKRLTLDIPETLHRKIKGKAVVEGLTMVEMLRELLETTYG